MSDLPKGLLEGTAVKCEATPLDRLLIKLEWHLGSALNWLGFPGVIKPMQVYDRLTDTHIKVATGHLFTIITVNGNDYYFRRLDGKFDGSGKQF